MRRGADRRTGPAGLSSWLFLFLFLSLALLVLSRMQHGYVRELRAGVEDLVTPVLSSAQRPLEPLRRFGRRVAETLTVFEEVDRLRAENQKLKGWEWRARDLERKLTSLSDLARVVDEPGTPLVTTRVIADASGPFVRSVLIDAGRDHGVRTGHPVVSADGLVGRIVQVGRRGARLMLATDINSRIPVVVGKGSARAMMLGDNGPSPRLAHLPEGVEVAAGDEVATSGVAGVYPRGLRIGTLVDDGSGTLRVAMLARLNELDYVSVLLFETPALDLVEDDRMGPHRAPRSLAGRSEPSPAVRR